MVRRYRERSTALRHRLSNKHYSPSFWIQDLPKACLKSFSRQKVQVLNSMTIIKPMRRNGSIERVPHFVP